MKENTNIDLAAIAREAYERRCVAAGAGMPDRSAIRSAWNMIGFYKPQAATNFKVTWRR